MNLKLQDFFQFLGMILAVLTLISMTIGQELDIAQEKIQNLDKFVAVQEETIEKVQDDLITLRKVIDHVYYNTKMSKTPHQLKN